MAELLKPDLCVIGAGPAGLAVATAAAGLAVPVVLIDRSAIGGGRLNSGCVASKALLAAARRAALIRESAPFGIGARHVDVDFKRVREHVQGVTTGMAPNDSRERLTALGIQVVQGGARFKDRTTVTVGDAFEVSARRFVIATGSSPAMPAIAGLDSTFHFTSESIFKLTTLPKRLIVIGAGTVGLELAQGFSRLGSAVTVLDEAQPLADDDPECAAVVVTALARDGIVIRGGVKIVKTSGTTDKVQVTVTADVAEESIEGTHLLVAAGRRPNIAGLDLDLARIVHGPSGIKVGKTLKTTNRRVYAIGDVIGQKQSAHAGQYHADLVIRDALLRQAVRVDNDSIPRVTFTDPELAQAGLTEAQARQRGMKIRVARWSYHDNDRARTERNTAGHIKIVTDKNGRILGATIVGAQASELITPWTLAISQHLNIRAFAGIVVPYPTLSEIGKQAAIDFFPPSLTGTFVQRIMAWLRL